jgi:hypothetical protein
MDQPPHPWPRPPEKEGHRAFEIDVFKTEPSLHFLRYQLEDKSAAWVLVAAILMGHDEPVRRILAQKEIWPDFVNGHGLSPLIIAAALGKTSIAEMLASDVIVALDRQTRDGWTALHYAAFFGRAGVAESLLRHRARFDLQNSNGKEPFDLVKDKETREVFLKNKRFRRACPEACRKAALTPGQHESTHFYRGPVI